ncbi:MAG: KEOPS complex subunit Pcc1 [Nitrososphaerota archaeon]
MSEKYSQVKTYARMELYFETAEEAEIVLKSIYPDNYPLPRGLELNMKVEGEKLEVYVNSDRTILSLLTTLDDILSMIKLVLNSIRSISHKG